MARASFNVSTMMLALALASGAAAAEPAGQAPRTSVLRPAASSESGKVQIVVYKSTRRLALYRSGDFVKEYVVVLGLQPVGPKRHEGDARTPEGRYRISGKRAHARWQWFLDLDYPNAEDRRRYEKEISDGTIGGRGQAPPGIGGEIGIHGNDRLLLQAAGIDWTKGCIAMHDDDVGELAREVQVGTPVWIVE